MLITGEYNAVVAGRYPELTPDLEHEYAFFKRNYSGTYISDFHEIFESMSPDVRKMFHQVERLLKTHSCKSRKYLHSWKIIQFPEAPEDVVTKYHEAIKA